MVSQPKTYVCCYAYKPKAGDSLYIDNEELQDGFDEVLRKAGILPPK